MQEFVFCKKSQVKHNGTRCFPLHSGILIICFVCRNPNLLTNQTFSHALKKANIWFWARARNQKGLAWRSLQVSNNFYYYNLDYDLKHVTSDLQQLKMKAMKCWCRFSQCDPRLCPGGLECRWAPSDLRSGWRFGPRRGRAWAFHGCLSII